MTSNETGECQCTKEVSERREADRRKRQDTLKLGKGNAEPKTKAPCICKTKGYGTYSYPQEEWEGIDAKMGLMADVGQPL